MFEHNKCAARIQTYGYEINCLNGQFTRTSIICGVKCVFVAQKIDQNDFKHKIN